MPRKKRTTEPRLLKRLRRHFGGDPARLPVVEQVFQSYERPNLHLAVEDYLAADDRRAELLGVVAADEYRGVSLARLARPAAGAGYDIGPVLYRDQELPGGRHSACVKRGLYLVRDGDAPLALLLDEPQYSHRGAIVAEVMAADRDRAEDFLRTLTRQTRLGKAYRGHVLSLEQDCFGNVNVVYHTLPNVARGGLILPDEVLRRVERHTLGFARHAAALRAAGRHIKRGILLHGPPGTGKTLTAMYLAAQMPGRTVLLLTGRGMGSIEAACGLARALEPATVIVEDVDLIGTERDHQTVSANALLFELLNQMDGLAEDADVLFVLTTNRPEMLEPALASRPGRIDQAVEVPLPDADCRRRLFELYGRGLDVSAEAVARLVGRTEGASGAFIRELLRKAAVLAAEENGSGPLSVREPHLEEALRELAELGGPLAQTLLGARVGARGQQANNIPTTTESDP